MSSRPLSPEAQRILAEFEAAKQDRIDRNDRARLEEQLRQEELRAAQELLRNVLNTDVHNLQEATRIATEVIAKQPEVDNEDIQELERAIQREVDRKNREINRRLRTARELEAERLRQEQAAEVNVVPEPEETSIEEQLATSEAVTQLEALEEQLEIVSDFDPLTTPEIVLDLTTRLNKIFNNNKRAKDLVDDLNFQFSTWINAQFNPTDDSELNPTERAAVDALLQAIEVISQGLLTAPRPLENFYRPYMTTFGNFGNRSQTFEHRPGPILPREIEIVEFITTLNLQLAGLNQLPVGIVIPSRYVGEFYNKVKNPGQVIPYGSWIESLTNRRNTIRTNISSIIENSHLRAALQHYLEVQIADTRALISEPVLTTAVKNKIQFEVDQSTALLTEIVATELEVASTDIRALQLNLVELAKRLQETVIIEEDNQINFLQDTFTDLSSPFTNLLPALDAIVNPPEDVVAANILAVQKAMQRLAGGELT